MKPIIFFLVSTALFAISCKKVKLPESGGIILDKAVFTESSGAQSIIKYEYSQNKLIAVSASSSTNATVYNDSFEYNAQGRVIKHMKSNSVSGILFYYTFIYDANNRIVRSAGTPVLANLKLDDYTFAYDSQNRIVGDSIYEGSVLRLYRVYTYDNKNNIIATEQFEKSGSSFSSDGKINLAYDNKPNPRWFADNILYFGGFSYSNLSQNNIVSQIPAYGSSAFDYQYYKNGLLRKQISSNPAYQVEFFYK